MRKRALGSPVLIELVLVILFFGLSATTVARLLVAANVKSAQSEATGAAMVALENLAERIKADPAGVLAGETTRTVTETTPAGATLTAVITAAETDGGTLYSMLLTAADAGGVLADFSAAQYVPDWEAGA